LLIRPWARRASSRRFVNRRANTIPIITKLGINFEDGSGHFDCLALMPTPSAGTQGSGIFDKNIMYVTGPITGATIEGNTAVLTGTATVTGVGAGTNKPFTVTADRGGPGTKVVLGVSGLTFVETLLEGSNRLSGPRLKYDTGGRVAVLRLDSPGC